MVDGRLGNFQSMSPAERKAATGSEWLLYASARAANSRVSTKTRLPTPFEGRTPGYLLFTLTVIPSGGIRW